MGRGGGDVVCGGGLGRGSGFQAIMRSDKKESGYGCGTGRYVCLFAYGTFRSFVFAFCFDILMEFKHCEAQFWNDNLGLKYLMIWKCMGVQERNN